MRINKLLLSLAVLFCANAFAMEINTQINHENNNAISLDYLPDELVLQIIDPFLADSPRLLVAFQRLGAFSRLNKRFNTLAFSPDIQKILEKRLKSKIKSDYVIVEKSLRAGSDRLINFILGTKGINLGALIILKNSTTTSPLIHLLSCGYFSLLKMLINDASENNIFATINFQDSAGKYALTYAQENFFLEIEKILIENGADINNNSELRRPLEFTPLMGAINRHDIPAVNLLLEKKCNIDEQTINGNSALILSAQLGYLEIAQLLIKNKAAVDCKNNFGSTALMTAAQNGYLNFAKLLLQSKADINIKDHNGNTAFMIASYNGQLDLVKLLADNSTIDEININGRSALMLACNFEHIDIVQFLLANKADINLKGVGGYTALIIAAYSGHLELVKLLLANGADSFVTSDEGKTALDYAEEQGHKEIADLLRKAMQ